MGAHIAALLLRMFIMYFPFMIEAGMVYKAIPPLYSIKEGKKPTYFIDQIDFVKYVQKSFLSENTILSAKKEQLSSKDITKFFLTNTDYIYFNEKIANTYALDAYLLEIILYHYIVNGKKFVMKKLQKEIKSRYRFMDVVDNSNVLIVKGTIDKSNLAILNDKFLNDCRDILDIIERNDSLYYTLNGTVSSIYNIMKTYEKFTPKNLQRYKGLGEMNEDQLAESALRSDLNRTLIRYTMDNAKEALNLVREYESNTKKILSEVGIVTRDDLVD